MPPTQLSRVRVPGDAFLLLRRKTQRAKIVKMGFEAEKWLATLQSEFDSLIKQSMTEFREQLVAEKLFSNEAVDAAFGRIEPRVEKAVKVNIDKLEEYFRINSPPAPSPAHTELIKILTDVQKEAGDPAPRVEACFAQISDACKIFNDKRQQYLMYCLYDRYVERERGVWKQMGGALDAKVCEDLAVKKISKQKEFVEEFNEYLNQLQQLQSDLTNKLLTNS